MQKFVLKLDYLTSEAVQLMNDAWMGRCSTRTANYSDSGKEVKESELHVETE